MIDQSLQQTIFHIEKLRNVVNVGRSSAYNIYTSTGPALGHLGGVLIPAALEPSNEAIFSPESAEGSNRPGRLSWVRKALATFGSKD